ncbi:spermidine/putrescine transport system substrate-binding protein [Tepidamorphus gemmatus]|uniref:Spermidine/putrescine transport system substrate-binding protein n=1 Tax=Tepidamorphus gemmatus TaxID=747076 RepID=A0A4R3M761_9HYPH|nr:extracellular solute-binding protein [Tepidamorphus gemmatus]TCT09160.1 spermidine/putrescine transport system substrate-binding protein [Tepidamorphus gemmatus]
MTTVNRRSMLKATAATGAVLAAPAILRASDALASSGTVNVFAWGDYVQDNIKEAFEKATGITMNLSTYGSNDEAENKLRAAGGKGFDVVFPSVDTGPNYYKDNLLAEIDENKLEVNRVIPSIYRASISLGATNRGKRYLVPCDWGTEAITWNNEVLPIESAALSYGDLWREDLVGKVAVRQKSVLVSLAIYLDATGEVKSDRAMDLYKSADECKRVFEAVTDWAIKHKKNIGAFWNNATEATAAFTDAGCVIGQTWDTTGLLLNRDNSPKWQYSMPKEGGLAWLDTMAIPSGAENVEQAYAFINFMLSPETGGMFANNTGYNSAAVGAENFLNEAQKKGFAMAYPTQEAIDNLWWWPAQTDFFASLRSEYSEKLTNA